MKFRRIALWALIDMLGTSLGVALMAVNPTHAKVDGIKPKAEFLITADWDVRSDSDVDLWVVGPDHKPVFYGNRQEACADLDRDSLGYSTSRITLVDGSVIQQDSNKETTSIHCLAPGHWDVGVNLYSDRELDKGAKSIPVHVELTGVNPQVRTLFAADVSLDKVGQTINVFSFDLDADGHVTMTKPPIAPLTDTWRRPSPGGVP